MAVGIDEDKQIYFDFQTKAIHKNIYRLRW